jgi:hypothetical protein
MSATERFQLVALAVAFLCVGSAMASFDVVRARAGRPIAGGRDAIQLYWIVYLAMFVLAITSAVAATVR